MNLEGPLRVCSRGQYLWTTTGGWNGEDGAELEFLKSLWGLGTEEE